MATRDFDAGAHAREEAAALVAAAQRRTSDPFKAQVAWYIQQAVATYTADGVSVGELPCSLSVTLAAEITRTAIMSIAIQGENFSLHRHLPSSTETMGSIGARGCVRVAGGHYSAVRLADLPLSMRMDSGLHGFSFSSGSKSLQETLTSIPHSVAECLWSPGGGGTALLTTPYDAFEPLVVGTGNLFGPPEHLGWQGCAYLPLAVLAGLDPSSTIMHTLRTYFGEEGEGIHGLSLRGLTLSVMALAQQRGGSVRLHPADKEGTSLANWCERLNSDATDDQAIQGTMNIAISRTHCEVFIPTGINPPGGHGSRRHACLVLRPEQREEEGDADVRVVRTLSTRGELNEEPVMVLSVRPGDQWEDGVTGAELLGALRVMLTDEQRTDRTWIPECFPWINNRNAVVGDRESVWLVAPGTSTAHQPRGVQGTRGGWDQIRIMDTTPPKQVRIATKNLGRKGNLEAMEVALTETKMPDVFVGTETQDARGRYVTDVPDLYAMETRAGNGAPHGVCVAVKRDSGFVLRRWADMGDDDLDAPDCLVCDVLHHDRRMLTVIACYNPPQGAALGAETRGSVLGKAFVVDPQLTLGQRRSQGPAGNFTRDRLVVTGDFNPTYGRDQEGAGQMDWYLENDMGMIDMYRAPAGGGPTHRGGNTLDAICISSSAQLQLVSSEVAQEPGTYSDHTGVIADLLVTVPEVEHPAMRATAVPATTEQDDDAPFRAAYSRVSDMHVQQEHLVWDYYVKEFGYATSAVRDITHCVLDAIRDFKSSTGTSADREAAGQAVTQAVSSVKLLLQGCFTAAAETVTGRQMANTGQAGHVEASRKRHRRTWAARTRWAETWGKAHASLKALIAGPTTEQALSEARTCLAAHRRASLRLEERQRGLDGRMQATLWGSTEVNQYAHEGQEYWTMLLANLDHDRRAIFETTERGARRTGHALRNMLGTASPREAHRYIADAISRKQRAAPGLEPVTNLGGEVLTAVEDILEAHAQQLSHAGGNGSADVGGFMARIAPHMPRAAAPLNLFCRSNAEVDQALDKLKHNKAVGPDGIRAELLTKCYPCSEEDGCLRRSDALLDLLRAIYNLTLFSGIQPEAFQEGFMRPVSKRKQGTGVTGVDEFRPICWTSSLSKVVSTIANQKVMWYCENHGLFGQDYAGFRIGKNCQQAYSAVMEWITQRRGAGGFLVFFDIKGAFDSCKWNIIEAIMTEQGWGRQTVRFLMARMQVAIRVRDPLTRRVSTRVQKTAGTPYGEILSPTIFLVLMGVLLETLRKERLQHGHHQRIVTDTGRYVECGQVGYADDYVALTSNWNEAVAVMKLVKSLFALAGMYLGIKPLTASGQGTKTAIMAFGYARDSIPGDMPEGVACRAADAGEADGEWTIPLASSYLYLGLLISTQPVRISPDEVAGLTQARDIWVIDMAPHVRRRIAMAYRAARDITRAAVNGNWAVSLHAQLLHAGAITSAFYGAEAAACATGWDTLSGLGYGSQVFYGMELNLEVLKMLDKFLLDMRWMIVSGSTQVRPFTIGGRYVPNLAMDTELLTASAAGRVAMGLLDLIECPYKKGLDVAARFIHQGRFLQGPPVQTGPLGAALALGFRIKMAGWTQRIDDAKDWLGCQETAKKVTKWRKSKSGAADRSFTSLSLGCSHDPALSDWDRERAALGVVMLNRYATKGRYAFGPGAMPTAAVVQEYGHQGRRILRIRAGQYPQQGTPNLQVMGTAVEQMERAEHDHHAGTRPWQPDDADQNRGRSPASLRKAWAKTALAQDPWDEKLEHTSRAKPIVEDALTRIERTIARSSERTAIKELANRVVQVIRNQLRYQEYLTCRQWMRGDAAAALAATATQELIAATNANARLQRRMFKPHGLLRDIERQWAKGMSACMLASLKDRETQRRSWRRKWWVPAGDPDVGLDRALCRAHAPHLYAFSL